MPQWYTMDWGYNDVTCDDIIESPLYLYIGSDGIALTHETQKRIEPSEHRPWRYRVVAEITAIWDHRWEIDFGLRAISRGLIPEGARRGSYITGEINLGFEYPSNWRGYEWLVKSITKETAPLIPIDDEEVMRRSPKFRVPDMTRATYTRIERTDGFADEQKGDHTEYILHCRLLDGNSMDESQDEVKDR